MKMKIKAFAAATAALLLIIPMGGCGDKVSKDELVTDMNGEGVVAVTEDGGRIARDDYGNVVVEVTDENGKKMKDENGEYVTEGVELTKAVVIGNRIENAHCALTVPKGWSDASSYGSIQIQKDDGSTDSISIDTLEGTDEMTVRESCLKLLDAIADSYSLKVKEDKLKIDGTAYTFDSVYVEKDSSGGKTFVAFIVVPTVQYVNKIMVTLHDDPAKGMNEINDILNSVEFHQ
ncbi:MAG: hypothetical protein K6B52_04815 [Clostridiales bacterium]|nr:hypothetical protein [Clostridiales bacterium]